MTDDQVLTAEINRPSCDKSGHEFITAKNTEMVVSPLNDNHSRDVTVRKDLSNTGLADHSFDKIEHNFMTGRDEQKFETGTKDLQMQNMDSQTVSVDDAQLEITCCSIVPDTESVNLSIQVTNGSNEQNNDIVIPDISTIANQNVDNLMTSLCNDADIQNNPELEQARDSHQLHKDVSLISQTNKVAIDSETCHSTKTCGIRSTIYCNLPDSIYDPVIDKNKDADILADCAVTLKHHRIGTRDHTNPSITRPSGLSRTDYMSCSDVHLESGDTELMMAVWDSDADDTANLSHTSSGNVSEPASLSATPKRNNLLHSGSGNVSVSLSATPERTTHDGSLPCSHDIAQPSNRLRKGLGVIVISNEPSVGINKSDDVNVAAASRSSSTKQCEQAMITTSSCSKWLSNDRCKTLTVPVKNLNRNLLPNSLKSKTRAVVVDKLPEPKSSIITASSSVGSDARVTISENVPSYINIAPCQDVQMISHETSRRKRKVAHEVKECAPVDQPVIRIKVEKDDHNREPPFSSTTTSPSASHPYRLISSSQCGSVQASINAQQIIFPPRYPTINRIMQPRCLVVGSNIARGIAPRPSISLMNLPNVSLQLSGHQTSLVNYRLLQNASHSVQTGEQETDIADRPNTQTITSSYASSYGSAVGSIPRNTAVSTIQSVSEVGVSNVHSLPGEKTNKSIVVVLNGQTGTSNSSFSNSSSPAIRVATHSVIMPTPSSGSSILARSAANSTTSFIKAVATTSKRIVKVCRPASMWSKFAHWFTTSALDAMPSVSAPSDLCLPHDSCIRYRCVGCSIEFVTKAGIEDHYARKSLCVMFTCECDHTLHSFYNMCSFARFYKSHTAEAPSVQHSLPNLCTMVVLPVEQMPREYESTKKRLGASMSMSKLNKSHCNAPVSVLGESHINNLPVAVIENITVSKALLVSSATIAPVPSPVLTSVAPVKMTLVPVSSSVEPTSSTKAVTATPKQPAITITLRRSQLTATTVLSRVSSAPPLKSIAPKPVERYVKTAAPLTYVQPLLPDDIKLSDLKEALEERAMQCSECRFVMKNHRSLSVHFIKHRNRQEQATHLAHECMRCGMVLPNTCSLRAHTRLHSTGTTPLVCPECGKCFDKSRSEIFLKHVTQVCVHYARSPGAECPKCEVMITPKTSAIARHLTNLHAATYRKCATCPMAFTSEEGFKRHSLEKHDGAASHQVIAKCPICEKVLPAVDELEKHIVKHLQEGFQCKTYPFKCVVCGKGLATKTDLVEHMKVYHPDDVITELMCEVCTKQFADISYLYSHMLAEHRDVVRAIISAPIIDNSSDRRLKQNRQAKGGTPSAADDLPIVSKSLPVRRLRRNRSVPDAAVDVSFKQSPKTMDETLNEDNQSSEELENPQDKNVLREKKSLKVTNSLDRRLKQNRPVKLDRRLKQKRSVKSVSAPVTDSDNSPKVKEVDQKSVSPHVSDLGSVKAKLSCDRCQLRFSTERLWRRHHAKHKYLANKRHSSAPESAEESIGDSKKSETLSNEDDYSLPSKRRKQENILLKPVIPKIVIPKAVITKAAITKGDHFLSQVPSAIPELKFSCSDCDLKFSSNVEIKLHLETVHKIVSWFPCHLCDVSFKESALLQLHLKERHSGKTRRHAFICWICRDQGELKSYPRSGMLMKHLKKCHKVKRGSPEFAKIVEFELMMTTKLDTPNSPSTSSTNGDTSTKSPVTASTSPEIRRLRVAGGVMDYNCAQCDFSATGRTVFLAHIVARHRLDDAAHQCTECGSCFSVLPALKRHLFVVHRVRDFEVYTAETGVDVESTEETTSSEVNGCTLNFDVDEIHPNKHPTHSADVIRERADAGLSEAIVVNATIEEKHECTVCYKVFEDAQAHRSHMRVHGMAFIQRTARRSIPAALPSASTVVSSAYTETAPSTCTSDLVMPQSVGCR